MHKNDVPGAAQETFSEMEKPRSTNSDSDVRDVSAHLYGESHPTDWLKVNTGSGYGLPRAAQYDYSASYLVIVNPNSAASRITGLARHPGKRLITPASVTWSMTAPTSIRMAACSI